MVAALFSAEKIYMTCQHMAKCEECTPAHIKNICIHSTKQFAAKGVTIVVSVKSIRKSPVAVRFC